MKSYKIIITGPTKSGKTSFISHFAKNVFPKSYKESIGADFFIKKLIIGNEEVKLQIWELVGDERFRFLLSTFVTNAHGAILLFDITKPFSYDNISDWLRILRYQDPYLPVLLIGNKSDLVEDTYDIDRNCLKFVETFNLVNYLKISSKSKGDVEKAINELISIILEGIPINKKEIILSLILGYFPISTRRIFDYLNQNYSIRLSIEELTNLIESDIDGFSIGMDPMLDPESGLDSSVIVPWNLVILYINNKLSGIPQNQHDRLFFKDIRNSLFFPDYSFVGLAKDRKMLEKLKYVIEHCNERGYFLRNVVVTEDSIEIPVFDENNLLLNLKGLKSAIELNFNIYLNSFSPEIHDELNSIKRSLNEKLIFLINLHRDKTLPELIEVSCINQEDWDSLENVYNKWKKAWYKLKKGLKLEKILILKFKCDNCEKTYRFVYYEKTKFFQIAAAILRIAPWAKNVIDVILLGNPMPSILIGQKPKTLKESSKIQNNSLLPEEITFMYQTLIGIEDDYSKTMAETFILNPENLKFNCSNCKDKK